MNRLASVLVLVAACNALACSVPPAPQVQWPTFDEAEYASFEGKGTSTVKGQAFLRTVGGDVKTAAGSTVTLDPATTYCRFWWVRFGRQWRYRDVLPPDAAFLKFRRSTVADSEGRFTFTGLQAGSYVIRSAVLWKVPTTVVTASQQGGLVWSEVTVEAGETKETILTWQ